MCRLLLFCLSLVLIFNCAEGNQVPDSDMLFLPQNGPSEIDYPELQNLLKINGKIYSGGQPKDEKAFRDLSVLGVQTIVSVDGALPNVGLARKHGMRYVHIPIGYDGIPTNAQLSLTRLINDANPPYYIHCHHGRHRGPAAAAIACIASGGTDNAGGLSILEHVGTSLDYPGLWKDVESFVPVDTNIPLPQLVEQAEVGVVGCFHGTGRPGVLQSENMPGCWLDCP